jgi:peptidoglycan/LPS O-acetylase OafA/YrhL
LDRFRFWSAIVVVVLSGAVILVVTVTTGLNWPVTLAFLWFGLGAGADLLARLRRSVGVVLAWVLRVAALLCFLGVLVWLAAMLEQRGETAAALLFLPGPALAAVLYVVSWPWAGRPSTQVPGGQDRIAEPGVAPADQPRE